MKILTNYDFNQNQLVNAVIQKLATPPANPVSGQLYFDTAKERLFTYNGKEWIGADALDAMMTGESIVNAINDSASLIDDDNLSQGVRDAISKAHNTHSITDITGLQNALDEKVSVVTGKELSTNDYTTAEKNKLAGISAGANKTTKSTTNGNVLVDGEEVVIYTHPTGTNPHGTTKADVGLGKVDNTADLDKPISTATQTALNEKVNNSRVLTDVPSGAKFTDTVTTVNGNAGAISKADIVALGIPSSDTTYSVFSTTKDGLVPKTTTSNTTNFLRRDGTWASPPNTKYTLPVASSTALGGVKSGTDITIDESGNVSVNDNSHKHTIENVTGLQSALDAKETPSGATAKASTAENNAKGYTDTKLAELVGSAPETLDTLHELAQALGSDPNFATTMTNMLSQKTDKYTTSVGDGTLTSFVITHNLNTRDVVVQLRETASPYAMVITDVEMTSVNTVTLKFAVPPTSNEYTITVIG